MSETSAPDPRVPSVTVAADFAQLGHLRATIAQLAHDNGAPDDIVETFQLVVSELATNVMLHSTSDTVTIAFERIADEWQLVISDAEGIVLPGSTPLPDPDQLAGRGLFIVEAVMDRVELAVVDGRQYVRCIKRAN